MNVYFSVIKLELVPLLICLIQDSEHETWTVFYNFLKKANRSVKLTLFIPHFKIHSHSDLKYMEHFVLQLIGMSPYRLQLREIKFVL